MAIKIEIGGMLGQFSKFSPDTLKGYLTISGANARTTVLGEKGRLVKHARYYWLLLAESHLTRRLFGVMGQQMADLPIRAG